MAKLGSHKRPAVVRVQDFERAQEVMRVCNENDWQVIVGIEPDKSEDISDVEKLINPPKTALSPSQPKIGRNDSCICGSGRKYKKCCFS
jgi:SWIM/SEC-C metal-binding protein